MSITLLLAVQVAVASGCNSPVEVESAADFAVPIHSISDGVHGGQGHFFFLPPLVPAPEYDGNFDGSRSPRVQICAPGETSCAPLVAEFTTDAVPGFEWVRVDSAAEHYIVNWHTNEFELEPGGFYRIRVLVGGLEAGHADIKVETSGNAEGAASFRCPPRCCLS